MERGSREGIGRKLKDDELSRTLVLILMAGQHGTSSGVGRSPSHRNSSVRKQQVGSRRREDGEEEGRPRPSGEEEKRGEGGRGV
eukprot:477824-Hanusia_phi.AAC.1